MDTPSRSLLVLEGQLAEQSPQFNCYKCQGWLWIK